MATYASIGRNVNNEPMSSDRWRMFKARLRWTMESFTGPLVSVCEGVGFYNGKVEDTFIVVGALDPSVEAKEALTAAIAYLSFSFDQECIALVCGTPQFIKPEKPSDAKNAIGNRIRHSQIVD